MLSCGYVPSTFVAIAMEKCSGSAAPGYRRKKKRDRKLLHLPIEVKDTCLEFLESVAQKNSKSILIRKINSKTGDRKEKYIPYMHRHCEGYRKTTIAKMQYAKEYLGDDCQSFMISGTVAHGKMDYEECLYRVRDAKKKLNRKLRDLGYKSRVWFNDAHWNGYTHFHVLVVGSIDSFIENKLKLFWCCHLNMGDIKHGLHIKIPNSVGVCDSSYKSGSVKHFASYMMKYIGKTLTSSFEDPKFLVFSALLWKTKSRLYGFSRDISSYVKEQMEKYKENKYGKKEASDWVYDGAAICDNEGIVLSEIPKCRKKPVIIADDVYLYSVHPSFLSSFYSGGINVNKINHLIDSGRYVTKRVGDMIEVYERIVNFSI